MSAARGSIQAAKDLGSKEPHSGVVFRPAPASLPKVRAYTVPAVLAPEPAP